MFGFVWSVEYNLVYWFVLIMFGSLLGIFLFFIFVGFFNYFVDVYFMYVVFVIVVNIIVWLVCGVVVLLFIY